MYMHNTKGDVALMNSSREQKWYFYDLSLSSFENCKIICGRA